MDMEHEYVAIVPPWTNEPDTEEVLLIGVDKIGGGTLGEHYTGLWDVFVYSDTVQIEHTQIHTGMPKRHDEVAGLTAQFVADKIDEVDDMDRYDRLVSFYSMVLPE